ncbi:MAG: hydantoinase B/oxoprolinase family protein, partial [Verrucomicrobia bacterium]|nr:hydantoinase B/oxoprolinase family protein [Verrucomicrobiota bacterium]
IVHSALVYCLRVWIGQCLPLNDGLLNRTRITLPDCFLNPTFPEEASRCPAVAAGNTESSQNIVEAFMKATQLMASSQGTMNNVIFGNDRFSFYETLGGGTGAGPGFHGTDAIHSHMTNTAITDPEILEYNFPVILRRWGIAPHTGGLGQWNGGHGMIREIQFQEAVQVNLITHHRTSGPMGLKGGLPGSPGAQTISRSLDDGSCQTTRLPHIAQFDAKPGDILSISTPGGGAYLPQP